MRLDTEVLILPEEKRIKPETAYLTATVSGMILDRAKEENVPRGEIVRRAVHEYLGVKEPVPRRYQTEPKPNPQERY